MDNSLHDRNSELPSLGAGNLDTPMLTADIDDEGDEEFNALNEETFGNDETEEDWEESHERLTAAIEGNLTNILANDDASSSDPEKSNQTRNLVEKSINQLVLEDELDDPAIMSRSKPVSTKSVSDTLKSIFNRSPPPPAFINSDMTGSPVTDGIWSSPHNTRPPKPSSIAPPQFSSPIPIKSERHVSFHHEYLKTPPQLKNLNLEQKSRLSSSFDLANLHPMKILPNMRTVEELENELLMDGAKRSERQRSSSTCSVLTLEDVEREIFLKPRAKMVEEIENEISIHAPPPTPGGIDITSMNKPNFALPQMPIGTPPKSSMHHFNVQQPQLIRSVMPDVGAGSPRMRFPPKMNVYDFRHSPPNRPPMNRPGTPIPVNMNMNSRMMPPQLRNFNDRSGMHYPMFNNIGPPPGMPHRPPMQRFPYGGMDSSQYNIPGYIQRQHPPIGPGFHPGGDMPDQYMEYRDPYSGLMTQREKDWLIKIQLLQLQRDNPYIDDFYYMAYRMKQIAKEKLKRSESSKDEQQKEPKLVLPERGKLEAKHYTPTQYQGSLGKIQAISVNNPRKSIDIDVAKSADDDEEDRKRASKELRRYREALSDIEKLYDIILAIDDLEKRMLALPVDAQTEHHNHRVELINKFYKYLKVVQPVEKFLFIMKIRKGKRAVIRIYPMFDEEQKLCTLEAMIKCFSVILRRDQVDQVLLDLFPDVENVIREQSTEQIVRFGQHLLQNQHTDGSSRNKSTLDVALNSKFGLTFLLLLLDHAEKLFEQEKFDELHESNWCMFVINLHKSVVSSPKNTIAAPVISYPSPIVHFKRFVTDSSELDLLSNKFCLQSKEETDRF